MQDDSIWVLVLNATRARILWGTHRNGAVQDTRLVLRSENRKLRSFLTGGPGRGIAPGRVGRRVSVATDLNPLRDDAHAFVREVIAVLEAHRRAGDFNRLAIFSPPEMLAILRAELPGALKAQLVVEAEENLVQEPEAVLMNVVAQEVFGP